MKINVYLLHAFVKKNKGGNPAGVVIDSYNLNNEQKQNIAKQIGFSETAFIEQSDKADFKVSFFTPAAEVDLCGHATIAAFSLLKSLHLIKEGKYTQETKAGILNIVLENQMIFMNQNLPVFSEILEKDRIIKSLNLQENDLSTELPIQVVSTGLRDILVPIKDYSTLNGLEPDFDQIKELSREYNAAGIHAFTLETNNEAIDAHCRNFAPLYEIPEESATGTASGALACYLTKYIRDHLQDKHQFIFEQGSSMGKPSEIIARINEEAGLITEVKVGGRAILVGETEINPKISFRKLKEDDLPLLYQWMNKEHVIEWYTKKKITYERVVEKYTAYIQGSKPVEAYLILIDLKPIGYIQTYKIDDLPQYKETIAIKESAAGIDLYIGEEDFIHQGLGSKIIDQFVQDIVIQLHVESCIIGPEPKNVIAIKSYKKAGFSYLKTVYNPNEEGYEYLLRRSF